MISIITKSGGKLVAEALKAEETSLVFAVTGTQVSPIFDALYDTDVRTINVRHENTAAIMADVYGRLKGEPGVCLVIGGPGATNTTTGVAHAFTASSPMIHISGDVSPTAPIFAHHGVEDKDFLSKIFQPITKMSTKVRSLGEIQGIISKGFGVSKSSPKGPVHIDIPTSILREVGETPDYRRSVVESKKPDANQVRKLVDSLKTADRPVIYFGDDLALLSVKDEAMHLVNQAGIPVATSMIHTTGLISQTHPLFIGHVGSYWDPYPIANEILKDADLVVTIGLRLGTPESYSLRKATRARLVCVVPNPTPFKDNLKAEELVGEADKVVKEMVRRWESPSVPRTGMEKRVKSLRSSYESKLLDILKGWQDRRPVHPGLAAKELARLIDDDAIIAGDAGGSKQWLLHYVLLRTPCLYLDPAEFGTMGWSVPAAIGAKILFPERQSIAVCGDGGFLMAGNELSTAMMESANVVIVIFNDSKYGMIWQEQEQHYEGRHIGVDVYTPDFVKYAESFGALGITVQDPSELESAFSKALSANKPTIVDIKVDHSQPYPSGMVPND